MSSIFDNLSDSMSQLGSSDLSFYDADTLYDSSGQGYRLKGVNALEVDTFGKEGEIGGQLTLEQVSRLANEKGYTNVVKLGEKDSTGNREMIDLQDDQGRSFARELAASGIARVQEGFDPTGTLTFSNQYRNFLKTGPDYEANDFDKAAVEVDKYIDENNRYSDDLKNAIISRRIETDFQRTDVDEQGMSINPYSTAWNTGMIGVTDAAWGMASLLGDTLGIESLYGAGEAGVRRARARIADQGNILTSYQDVDSFGDAVDFVANNTLLSIPYMGITAAAVATAPLTGGLSMIAPASIYTGQAWNEMGDQIKFTDKERSATIAIGTGVAQAALDRLGLAGITGSSGKELYKKGVAKLVDNGMDKAAAEAAMAQATKREMASLLGDVGTVAREQLNSKHLTVDLLKRMRNGAISEGATEGLQEAIAGIGADIGSDTDIDWKDIEERAINGMVAGATLGSAFSIPGAAMDAGQWANLAWGVEREDPNAVANATRYAREERDRQVKALYREARAQGMSAQEATEYAQSRAVVPTVEETLKVIREAPDALEGFNEQADRGAKVREKRTFKETVADAMANIPALWRGQVNHTITEDDMRKSRTARLMKDMFGGALQRIFGGSDYENAKHHRMTQYKAYLQEDPENIYTALNNGKKASEADRVRISKEIYSLLSDPNVFNRNGQFNPDAIPDSPRKAQIVQLINNLQTLSDKMYDDQKTYNRDLGYIKNYLLRFKTINKKAVYKNRNKFIQALKDKYNLSEEDAVNITDQIINTEMDLDEAFSVTKGGPQPQSHKRRSLNLSEQPEFAEFFEDDIFMNASAAAKAASRYITNQEYIGQNGKHIAKMLQQMRKEGLSQERVDQIAFRMRNYLDSESGNYKRATSELGKKWQEIQKSFMLFTMFAGLPLSTLSSFVEVALGMRGLTRDQIYGKKGGLSKLGQEFAQMIKDGMTEIANAPGVGKGKVRQFNTSGKALLRKLGFYEWDVGAATTTGVLETHSFHQKMAENYFKWIGLQGWTNFNRATRAAIAGDFIMDNLILLANRDTREKTRTNEEREAEEKLRNLGIDVSDVGVQQMLALLSGLPIDPEVEQRAGNQLREAQYNFVNEAVALPKAANRPLWYLDPRLALINQFQGFMSTFTANHIPRLWNEYIKRGSPAMRYNTFAMMATMIMLGFASQYLKDLLKYGESSPYLDENELIRRGILSSGLAGTSERIIEQFFPIYETRSKNAGEWIFNTASGESPSLSNIVRLSSAAGYLIEGDVDKATWNAAKATVGPLANLADNIYTKIEDKWDFK